MNKYERKRKAVTGLLLIQEAIADVLDEARTNNEGGLTAVAVEERIGGAFRNMIVLRVLHEMRDQGEVVNDHPTGGAGSWRLA